MTVAAELRKSRDSLELFTELVKSQIDRPEAEFERLLDGYLEARRSLARQFCLVAQRYLLRGGTLLETMRKRIEERMTELFGNRVPEKYLIVHGYTSVQPILLQYLAQHVGKPVRSSKLRILTADQIHTERRVRDLRDLGFDVEWKKVADEDQYVLKSVEPDLHAAATMQVRKNIRDDKKLAKQEKERLLRCLESEC
jgi:hypothetical protein